MIGCIVHLGSRAYGGPRLTACSVGLVQNDIIVGSIMNLKITKFEDFYNFFNFQDTFSFDEFKETLVSENNTPLSNFFDDELFKVLYNIKFNEEIRKRFLREWFNAHLRVKNIKDQLFFKDNLNRKYMDKDIIYGRDFINKSRIIKNLNFDKIFSTKKIYNITMFEVFKFFFEENVLYHILHAPKCKSYWRIYNFKGIFDYLRGTTNYASVMNPVFIKWFFDNFLEGESVFTPTLGWDSYLVAFFNSDLKEYVGVDVMDSQIEVGNRLIKYYDYIENDSFFSFDSNVKKAKVINCPSEKFDSSPAYRSNYFDNVFFSPPYYDLEKYEGGEQSIKNYPDYNAWLENYWEKTVQNSFDMLKTNGLFTYIISDYKQNDGKTVTVSNDTFEIAKKYFKEEKILRIMWKNFSTKTTPKNKEGNFENVYILRKC